MMKVELKEIEEYINKHPIKLNKQRKTAGLGRSQSFGVVNKRVIPHDYSRYCWTRPYLYKLLLEFGNKYINHTFNAITVNQNYKCEPHRDKGNIGLSTVVAFGDYIGGNLTIFESELKGSYNINCNPITAQFNNILHGVEEFTGNRYSLVYYYYIIL